MSACFHAFDDDGISSGILHTLGKLCIWNNRNAFDACMMKRFKPWEGIACTNGYEGDFLITDHLSNIIDVWRLQH
jgi:hypothetical protein